MSKPTLNSKVLLDNYLRQLWVLSGKTASLTSVVKYVLSQMKSEKLQYYLKQAFCLFALCTVFLHCTLDMNIYSYYNCLKFHFHLHSLDGQPQLRLCLSQQSFCCHLNIIRCQCIYCIFIICN